MAEYKQVHSFDLQIDQMKKIQYELASKVEMEGKIKTPSIIGGADISFIGDKAVGIVVCLAFPSLELIEYSYSTVEISMPYIPGYLAFRELPAFLKAWEKIKNVPDVVMYDGHGVAHPRGLGIASHASFFIDRPTIGIGKSLLYGITAEPAKEKFSQCPIYDNVYTKHPNDRIIGITLRSKEKIKPIYISCGNLISLQEAVKLTQMSITKHRLPEPTRYAHLYSQKVKKDIS